MKKVSLSTLLAVDVIALAIVWLMPPVPAGDTRQKDLSRHSGSDGAVSDFYARQKQDHTASCEGLRVLSLSAGSTPLST